jgi:hypothetical protein
MKPLGPIESLHSTRSCAELAAEVRLLLDGAEVVIVRRYVCHRCFQRQSCVSGFDAGAIDLERPQCQRCGWPMLTDLGAEA